VHIVGYSLVNVSRYTVQRM